MEEFSLSPTLPEFSLSPTLPTLNTQPRALEPPRGLRTTERPRGSGWISMALGQALGGLDPGFRVQGLGFSPGPETLD